MILIRGLAKVLVSLSPNRKNLYFYRLKSETIPLFALVSAAGRNVRNSYK